MISFLYRKFFSSSDKHLSHPRGFTLIELSLVMAIIGVMVAGALGAYKVVIVKEYRDTTQERLKEIQAAMVRFQAKNTNARLPMPAPLHLAPTDPNFGAEDNPNLTCSLPTPVVNDTVCAPVAPGGKVRVGMVPVKTLGLSNDMANDSWGRRFIYAVSENLADSVTVTPYNANNGKITLLDNSGTPMGNNIPFVIVSTGKDGLGGITTEGKNFPIPCPAVGTPEGDNCDLATPDTTFGDRIYSEASAATVHFDDYVRHTLDNISAGGGGGVEYIDDLKDARSDRATTRSNVFLGDGSGDVNTPSGIKGISNTAIGIDSLNANTDGSYNTATGMNAMKFNTSGLGNTASGASAMYANTGGQWNTANGAGALYSNLNSWGSTAVGYNAMYYANNTTANSVTYNTAVGTYALRGSSTPGSNIGAANTAIGYNAMLANSAGNSNTAVGVNALWQNNADNNTAIGSDALYTNNSGIHNTAAGVQALYTNSSGSANTAVGLTALRNNTTGSYNTAIGQSAMFNGGYQNTATGYVAMYANTAGANNTADGVSAMHNNTAGSNNTAIGEEALQYNDSQSNNTAVGYQAMYYANNSTTAGNPYNTALGSQALLGSNAPVNNTGSQNTALGGQALWSNTAGSFNAATGYQSLYYNTSGAGNTAAGYKAMFGNMGPATGNYNTAVGYEALGEHSVGDYNTAIGYMAMFTNIGSASNVAVGYQAGYGGLSYTLGSNNTFIGNNTQVTASGPWSNSTALGNGAIITASNMVQIGNSAITLIHLGTSASAVTWATITAWSDRRLKKDIQDSDLGLDFIDKLRPVSYRMKEGSDALRYGFIAQDVEKALGDRVTGIVTRDKDEKKTYGLSYTDLIAPIVKAIQEIVAMFHGQDKLIHEQQAQIEVLAKSVADLQAEVKALRK